MDTITKSQVVIKVAAEWQRDFESWLRMKKSGLTVRSYLLDLGVFARWFEAANGQGFEPGLLNSWDLRNYREWSLGTQRVSAATWNRRRASLVIFVEWAREVDLLVHDPMMDINGAERGARSPRWLTKAEFGRLMRQVEVEVNGANTELRKRRSLRDAAMISLMAFGGLRESEICGLQVRDVEIGPRKGKVIIRRGKGDKERSVPLSKEAMGWIGAWLECLVPGGSEKVFEGIQARAIQKRVAEFGELATVENMTPHRLRHSCAKRMLDAGRPITEVQVILGHSRLETTAVYLQPSWEDLEGAVESVALGAMLHQ
jgi:site-specific recombinase XerD